MGCTRSSLPVLNFIVVDSITYEKKLELRLSRITEIVPIIEPINFGIMLLCYCRLKWDIIRMLTLFLEHVLLKHSFKNDIAYLVRLDMVSEVYNMLFSGTLLIKISLLQNLFTQTLLEALLSNIRGCFGVH